MKNLTSIFSLFYLISKFVIIVILFQWLTSKYVLSQTVESPERVLFLGDSHVVGPFGARLDQLLRIGGYEVYTHGAVGATARWFLLGGILASIGDFNNGLENKPTYRKDRRTPKFDDLIEDVKPTMIIIELGANYEKIPTQAALQDMMKLTEKIRQTGARCLWVTFPAGRNKEERYKKLTPLIENATKGICDVFYSYKVTMYPATGGDGVHYSFKAGIPIANKWADLVYESILGKN